VPFFKGVSLDNNIDNDVKYWKCFDVLSRHKNINKEEEKMKRKVFIAFLLLVLVIGSVSAVDIRDRNGNLAGRIDGNIIRDRNANMIGRIDGDIIRDRNANMIGRIDGNIIRDRNANMIGRASGGPAQVRMAALLAFFFFYLI